MFVAVFIYFFLPLHLKNAIQMIKPKKIVAADLRHAHPGQRGHYTDAFYVQLANELLNDFVKSRVDLDENTPNILRYAAISLTCYMEDIVADSGQWRTFSNLCQQLFGWPVPMYHDADEEYYPDEPSMMAIRYLIWNAATEMDDVWWKTEVPVFDQLARIAYNRLNSMFEDVPVNRQLVDDIDELLQKSTKDFLTIRPALVWVYTNCYLTRSENAERLLQKMIDNSEELSDMLTEPMRLYYAIMNSIFLYKVGPLALYPKDWLAALMRTRQMPEAADEVEAIEVLHAANYKYTISDDGKMLDLERTDGLKLQLAREEITLPDSQLRQCDACTAVFVSYQGAWHMNGVMMPYKNTDSWWERARKEEPNYVPEGLTTADAKWFLEHTGGKRMLFFAGKKEAEEYLKAHKLFTKNGPDFLPPNRYFGQPIMMFIDERDSKGILNFTFGFTPCIAAPDNPFYDNDIARQEAVEMLWNYDSVGTNAMLYMLDHGYLPEILTDDQFCQDSTDRDKEADVRFLLRYMRRENY